MVGTCKQKMQMKKMVNKSLEARNYRILVPSGHIFSYRRNNELQ